MAQKLTEVYDYLKNGGKNLKGYRLHLAKKPIQEIVGFDKNTDIEVIYEKGKIIIQKYEQK